MANALLGGWQVSTIFRYSSALPFFFRVNGTACNVPGEFRAGCIPAIVNPDAVFAQDKGSFDPSARSAVQQGRVRAGERVQLLLWARQSHRGETSAASRISNQDLSFIKNTRLPGNTNLQLRVEMFNVWNWHIFSAAWSTTVMTRRSTPTSPARTSAGGTGR